jgi:SpoIID/LytB domain protein
MRAVLRGRLPVAAVAVVAIVGAVTVAYAHRGGAVTTNETYPTPASRVFTIAGHGNGHGHGLSQYGAKNRADAGQSADQILAFYYPGTVKGTIPATGLIRIKLTPPDGDTALTVTATPDLSVRDSATGSVTALTGGGQYQIENPHAGLMSVKHSTGGGVWSTVTLTGGATTSTGVLQFSRSTAGAVLHWVHANGTARDYAGDLSAQLGADGVGLSIVNETGIDEYVKGVVPAEVFSSWPAATLQAQAVAARTYAAFGRANAPANQGWDTCDTPACQAYGGVASYTASGTRTANEPASVVNAVTATAGQVRMFNGALAFTQFSASNGGWTVADGTHPYLAAAADPYDLTGNPYANWTATVTSAQLASCFLPGGSTVNDIVITSRDGNGDWHGRVTGVHVDGRQGSAAVVGGSDGDGLRRCAGLRSVLFTITSTTTLTTEPAGVRDSKGNVDVFAAGPTGGVLHRRYVVNQGWQPWQSLGGSLVGSPGALRLPDGSSRVYIRGTNNGLYEGKLDASGGFHGWTAPRAGGVTSRPYPVRLSNGSVQVFYLSGATLRYAAFTAADAGAGAFNLGGTLAPGVAPAAAVTGPGAVTAFATVPGTGVWTRSLAAGRWGGWTKIGGSTTGDLAAASPAAGVADLYARGAATGSLYARRFAGGRWGGWTNTGGALSTGVFAAAVGATTDVWTLGTNTVTYLRTRTASGLGGWSPLP